MSSSNVSYFKGRARRSAAFDAQEAAAGVGLARISASARTHERRTQDLEAFRREFPTLHAQQAAIARASDQARSALGPKSTFSAGETLAWRNLLRACGSENAIAFLKHARESCRRRDLESIMREMKGAKFLPRLPAAAQVTVAEAFRQGLLRHSMMTVPEAAPAVEVEEAVEELEVAVKPWPMTPWLAYAMQLGYTTESARLARDPECEVQRVSVVAAAWRVLFTPFRAQFKA